MQKTRRMANNRYEEYSFFLDKYTTYQYYLRRKGEEELLIKKVRAYAKKRDI